MVSSVTGGWISHVWDSQIDMIESALSHGQGDGTSSTAVFAGIVSGRNLLWAVHRGEDILAVVILSVQSTSKMKKLIVEMIAGREMSLWADEVQKLLIDFKDIIGAACVEASCRPGLARFLGKTGWSKKAIIMELK